MNPEQKKALIQWHTQQLQEMCETSNDLGNTCLLSLTGKMEDPETELMAMVYGHPRFILVCIQQLYDQLPDQYKHDFIHTLISESLQQMAALAEKELSNTPDH